MKPDAKVQRQKLNDSRDDLDHGASHGGAQLRADRTQIRAQILPLLSAIYFPRAYCNAEALVAQACSECIVHGNELIITVRAA
jgi:hypothetical protein